MKPIYLDNHSTTKIDPRVMKAMMPFFSDHFGNPSSVHLMGEDAKEAIERAREQVASLINAKSDNIYFTNSATEANNIILKGYFNKTYYTRIISTNSEHSSILKTLERLPFGVNKSNPNLKINKDGNLNLSALEEYLLEQKDYNVKILVSIISANNEIGTIHDLYKIGEICKKYGALFHTDATQAIGKVDIDVDKMNIFALTLSGHKIYGSKGAGALYIRDESYVEPLTHGGYQNTFISGTSNVPAIVGLGMACEILQLPENKIENERIGVLRDLLLSLLKESLPDLIINGTMINRLPNNLNVTIPGVPSEALIKGMDDVIVSGGSACMSGNVEPSHVIIALGTPHPDCSIRFGLGRFTTKEEIDYAANRIITIVNSIRE